MNTNIVVIFVWDMVRFCRNGFVGGNISDTQKFPLKVIGSHFLRNLCPDVLNPISYPVSLDFMFMRHVVNSFLVTNCD